MLIVSAKLGSSKKGCHEACVPPVEVGQGLGNFTRLFKFQPGQRARDPSSPVSYTVVSWVISTMGTM